MTKRMNLANESYRIGLKALREGNREEADKQFATALQIIEQIKIEYPYHRESGVLYLKIQKAQLGDARFRAQFQTIMREAMNEPNLQKAYADLKDLEEIDPNFPGLKAAIVRVEGRIYQKPEVTANDRAESARLYDQARQLYNTRTRDNYKNALAQLNRALVLNPQNVSAQNLKNQILRELNIGSSYAISPDDLKILIAAENLVSRGDCNGAAALLAQLKRNPVNNNNPRVRALEANIEACR
ncbi:MAG TPA: hypothetical protein ENN69_00075 [Spirochaetia bacterium]|nr:hypothetical protein [Spirochaetia bacterium]